MLVYCFYRKTHFPHNILYYKQTSLSTKKIFCVKFNQKQRVSKFNIILYREKREIKFFS
nr:MAG TPA: hypothetical protein [Caudoviricetes sp.]